MKQIRILLADDHTMVRSGLAAFIRTNPNWTVCGEAEDGRQALASARKLKPDIVILDVTMPELNGLDAARQIKAECPETEILMYTAIEDEDMIRAVFEAGAKSYILKTEITGHLAAALNALAAHKPYFTTDVGEVLFARFLGDKTVSAEEVQLSRRERDVLQLVVEGYQNKEVADRLSISLKTVESHRAAIMRKLKLDSLPALVRYAIRHRIISA
jgi:DNA-binding NarL/FixJ family response regulator